MPSIINATTTNGLVTSADNSGSLQLATNSGTTAVTIDTSQNVGIGTTSPEYKLHVASGTAGVTGTNGRLLFSNGNTSGGMKIGAFTSTGSANGYLAFEGNDREYGRFDSSGSLLVGTTTQLFSGRFCIAAPLNTLNPISLQNTVTQGAGQSFMFMANSAGNKAGSIDHTGTTTVAYTTSSDYRMKENVQPMVGSLDKVLQLKPVTYNWKEDGSDGQGFIAHELQEVCPDAVVGEKDAVDSEGNIKPQGIDTSFLVATLTAAIQELNAKVDAQAAEIQALKGVA